MNFNNLKITKKENIKEGKVLYFTFIYKEGDTLGGSIEYNKDGNVFIEADFMSEKEHKVVPKSFCIGDKLTPVQEEFVKFLRNNKVPMETNKWKK